MLSKAAQYRNVPPGRPATHRVPFGSREGPACNTYRDYITEIGEDRFETDSKSATKDTTAFKYSTAI